jgi:ABC-type uncharacterized transport system substrate-binding protein
MRHEPTATELLPRGRRLEVKCWGSGGVQIADPRSRRIRSVSNVRLLIAIFCAVLFVFSVPAEGQQAKKIYRIGYLQTSTREQQLHFVKAFEDSLRNLGYTVGKDLLIEYRFANGKMERLPQLAADLVGLNVDVIVTGTNPNTLAAKTATSAIPIVMAFGNDPVGTGFVASLARPRGNITGLSVDAGEEIQGKRLELLKESVPNIFRVAVLLNRANTAHNYYLKTMESSARALNVTLVPVEYTATGDFDSAFRTMVNQHANGVNILGDGITFNEREKIARLQRQYRVPSVSSVKEFVEAGGLMSYGVDLTDNMRRAATYVDKILKGRKPAELPVEQPTKFEFVINLKAAKQIGLTIPPKVLARADRVIK